MGSVSTSYVWMVAQWLHGAVWSRSCAAGCIQFANEHHCWAVQALKANPSLAPKEVKISSNYITKFGQVALMEALDMVYEMSGDQREIVIHF